MTELPQSPGQESDREIIERLTKENATLRETQKNLLKMLFPHDPEAIPDFSDYQPMNWEEFEKTITSEAE